MVIFFQKEPTQFLMLQINLLLLSFLKYNEILLSLIGIDIENACFRRFIHYYYFLIRIIIFYYIKYDKLKSNIDIEILMNFILAVYNLNKNSNIFICNLNLNRLFKDLKLQIKVMDDILFFKFFFFNKNIILDGFDINNYLYLNSFELLFKSYNFFFNYYILNLNFFFNVDFKITLKGDGFIDKGYIFIPYYLKLLKSLIFNNKFKRITYVFFLSCVCDFLYFLNLLIIMYEYYIVLNFLNYKDLINIINYYLDFYKFKFTYTYIHNRSQCDYYFYDFYKNHNIWVFFIEYYNLIERVIYLLDINIYKKKYKYIY